MEEVFGEEGEECLVTGVPLVYTGQLGEEAQQEVLDRLLKPTTFGDRVVIATTALGLGLDDPLVMGILWLGAPSDVIVLDQQLGRAGRGKRNGFGIIFNAPGQTSNKDGDHSHLAWSGDGDIFGRQAMSDTISARDICRRWRMAEVLDGAGVSCMSIGAGDMMCDVCWEQALGSGQPTFLDAGEGSEAVGTAQIHRARWFQWQCAIPSGEGRSHLGRSDRQYVGPTFSLAH